MDLLHTRLALAGMRYCYCYDHHHHQWAVLQVHSVNCFTARWNWQGIAATADSRVARDVAGQRLKIRFEIVDKRFGVLAGPVKEDQVDPNRVQRGPYTVFLTLQVCCGILQVLVEKVQVSTTHISAPRQHLHFHGGTLKLGGLKSTFGVRTWAATAACCTISRWRMIQITVVCMV